MSENADVEKLSAAIIAKLNEPKTARGSGDGTWFWMVIVALAVCFALVLYSLWNTAEQERKASIDQIHASFQKLEKAFTEACANKSMTARRFGMTFVCVDEKGQMFDATALMAQ